MKIIYDHRLYAGPDSPWSQQKAHLVVEALSMTPDIQPIELVPIEPFELNHFALVHDAAHVARLARGDELNGFGTNDARTVIRAIHACQAFVTAATLALRDCTAVVAPVSGFHHAGYDYCSGYCTFNGLMLAIRRLKFIGALRDDDDVLIIDGDGHYGDGTDDIIKRLNLGASVVNLTRRHSPGPWNIGTQTWADDIKTALTARDWKLVLYQAGADAHAADPYLAGYLDDADFAWRDKFIATLCRHRQLPLAVCLAGGYNGEKTINLHRSTIERLAFEFAPGRPGGTQRQPMTGAQA